MAERANIGKLIKKMRKRRGLTQKQLAETCKISERWLKAIELEQGEPTFQTVFRLARALDIDIGGLEACVEHYDTIDETQQ